MGELSEGGQQVQTSSYKISSGNVMYSIMMTVNKTVLYISKLRKEHILKVLVTREKMATEMISVS